MTAFTNSLSYQVKWAKSKKLLADFIDRYNADRPLGEQIRSSHKQLSEHLLFLFSASVANEQAYGGGIAEGIPLPRLRTNNSQLSRMMGCSPRTVINLRERLRTAGIIRHEEFHGSNSQYEIEIAPWIIHIQQIKDPDNLIHRFVALAGRPEAAGAEAQPLQGDENFAPYSIQKQLQDTKKLNQLDGADFQNENPQRVCCQLDTELVTNQPEGEPETPPQVARRPPADAVPATPDAAAPTVPPAYPPATFDEACQGLPADVKAKINLHVTGIWIAAASELYADQWICEQEKERSRAVLAEYFTYARPERFSAGATEIIERIILVHRWIERGKAKGERRWVPLPSIYFDFRNPKGFTATKPWYKKHIVARAEIKASELLTKAVRQYLKSLEHGAKVGPSETYRRIRQRLGKYNQEILDRFHHQISNIHGSNGSSSASSPNSN